MSSKKGYLDVVVEEIEKLKSEGKEVREGDILLIKWESASGLKEVKHKVTKADLKMDIRWLKYMCRPRK